MTDTPSWHDSALKILDLATDDGDSEAAFVEMNTMAEEHGWEIIIPTMLLWVDATLEEITNFKGNETVIVPAVYSLEGERQDVSILSPVARWCLWFMMARARGDAAEGDDLIAITEPGQFHRYVAGTLSMCVSARRLHRNPPPPLVGKI